LILGILHNGILKLLRRIGNSIWTLGHISLLDALANTPIRTRQLQSLAPVWDIHRDKQLADKCDFPGQNRKKRPEFEIGFARAWNGGKTVSGQLGFVADSKWTRNGVGV